MLKIIFSPKFENDKLNSLTITGEGLRKPVPPINSESWISNIGDYLKDEYKESTGEVYLDKDMTKVIVDAKLTRGSGSSFQSSWIEITPYSEAEIVFTIDEPNNACKCEYPFSVSSKKKSEKDIGNSIDKVYLQIFPASDNKHRFAISQGQGINSTEDSNKGLDVEIFEGNQIRNIDSFAGNESKLLGNEIISFFHFQGELGVNMNKNYINGKFITTKAETSKGKKVIKVIDEENNFGFYYES